MLIRKLWLIVLILSVLSGCTNELDLSLIKLNENADTYDIDKNSSFNKIPISSELLVEYYSEDSKSLHYGTIPIDSSWNTHITVYENKIASIEVYVKEQYSLEFAKLLMQRLGKPTAILTERQTLDDKIATSVFNKFKDIFPDKTDWVSEEQNTLSYPAFIFWDKDNVYYILGLNVDMSGRIRNHYFPITKKAFRDNKIQGYPMSKDSPLSRLLK